MDASFKNANYNVLQRVNSMEKLRNLVETFTEEGKDLVAAMAGRWCNILTSLPMLKIKRRKKLFSYALSSK